MGELAVAIGSRGKLMSPDGVAGGFSGGTVDFFRIQMANALSTKADFLGEAEEHCNRFARPFAFTGFGIL